MPRTSRPMPRSPNIVNLDRLRVSNVDALKRLLRYLGVRVPRRRQGEYVTLYRLRLALLAALSLAREEGEESHLRESAHARPPRARVRPHVRNLEFFRGFLGKA